MRGDIGVFENHPVVAQEYELLAGDEPPDNLTVRELVKRVKATKGVHSANCVVVQRPALLGAAACALLVSWMTTRLGDEEQATLNRAELEQLIGGDAVRELHTAFASRVDLIRVRLVRAPGQVSFIKLHCDDALRTMQVALNGEDEYDGGRLVFATDEGELIQPSRVPGFATVHDNTIVHGVSAITRGARFSLFFLTLA